MMDSPPAALIQGSMLHFGPSPSGTPGSRIVETFSADDLAARFYR